MDPLSDEKLINSCLSGNQPHCRLLYKRYEKFIVNIIWKWVKDSEVTRDLTQETFLRAFKGLKGFRWESTFKNWLARIAVNLCIDHLKKSKRRHEKNHHSIDNPETGEVYDITENNTEDGPLEQMLQKELKVVIDSAIQKLGVEHEKTLLLSMEGFTYDEIAEITGVSTNTVGSRIHYAKMKLRKLLKPYMKRKKGKK